MDENNRIECGYYKGKKENNTGKLDQILRK
jgi:hypothetical protein